MAGCSHQQLDWRNAAVNGGKIYKGDENTPFTGNVTNIPDTLIYERAKMITQLDANGRNEGVQWRNNTHTSGGCDVYVKDGYLNGEVKCTDNGVVYLIAHFNNGQLYGEFKSGKDGNQPASHFFLEGSLDDHGAANGTQTWYYPNDAKQLVLHYNGVHRDGDELKYAEDGTPTMHMRFDADGKEDGIQEVWASTGQLIQHNVSKHGVLDGEVILFSVGIGDGGKPVVSEKPTVDKVYSNGQLVEDKLAGINADIARAAALDQQHAAALDKQQHTATLDQQYDAEKWDYSERDTTGLEKLKNKLCEGHWSINPPAGESICKQASPTSDGKGNPPPNSSASSQPDDQDGPDHPASQD
jgi:antitoxin component YwqK of YwqJK toxin-antitoxin module